MSNNHSYSWLLLSCSLCFTPFSPPLDACLQKLKGCTAAASAVSTSSFFSLALICGQKAGRGFASTCLHLLANTSNMFENNMLAWTPLTPSGCDERCAPVSSLTVFLAREEKLPQPNNYLPPITSKTHERRKRKLKSSDENNNGVFFFSSSPSFPY